MSARLRPGDARDVDDLAALALLASGGFIEYLYGDLEPGVPAREITRRGLCDPANPFSYPNATVAEMDGRIAGMAIAFAGTNHSMGESLRRRLPAARVEALEPYYALDLGDSYLLDTLAVYPDYRGHGLAGRLLIAVEQRAVQAGFVQVSLTVFSDNHPAVALYRQHGYKQVGRIPRPSAACIPYAGPFLLMSKRI